MRRTGESLSHLVRTSVSRELDVPIAVEPIDPGVHAGRGARVAEVDRDLKVRLDASRHGRLRDEAKRRGVSMAMLARTAIEDWLEREEQDEITLF